MGMTYIAPAGGLSRADKDTAKQWMVEGHELLHGRVQGTIPARAAATITPGTSNQIIPAGVYLSGEQMIRGDANLAPQNIARGVTIFGVTGTASILKPGLTYLYNAGAINHIGTLNGWSNNTGRGWIENETYSLTSCYFSNPIDITDFRTLSFMCRSAEGYYNDGYYITVGFTSNPNGAFVAQAWLGQPFDDGSMASCDISALKGYYYVKIEKRDKYYAGVRQIMINV